MFSKGSPHIWVPLVVWGAALASNAFEVVPYYVSLVAMATALIWSASYMSLAIDDREEGDDGKPMGTNDALMMPVTAAAVLVGLYFVFKKFDPEHVNMLLSIYFAVAAVGALGGLFSLAIYHFVGKARTNDNGLVTLPLVGKLTAIDLVGVVPAVALTAAYVATQHWVLNNIIASSFCLQAISRISVGKVQTGMLLLALLFVYDIGMVFGTGFMQAVAKSVKGPIMLKLLNPDNPPDRPFNILGLGDIALPGLFMAILLRFDASCAGAFQTLPAAKAAGKLAEWKPTASTLSFPAPVFRLAALLYVLGLAVTIGIMLVFNHAQPALLYLVPANLIAALAGAAITGRLAELWAYSEEEEEQEQEEGKGTREGMQEDEDEDEDDDDDEEEEESAAPSPSAPSASGSEAPSHAADSAQSTPEEDDEATGADDEDATAEDEWQVVDKPSSRGARRRHA